MQAIGIHLVWNIGIYTQFESGSENKDPRFLVKIV